MSPLLAARIHRGTVVTLALLMLGELGLALRSGAWMAAFLVAGIILITFAPILLRLPVRIPPEFQLLAVVFAFASLFLGEVRHFYERFWWWDIALHASSGLLLGLVGFLLVFALNQNRRVQLSMRPHFVALFALCFAVAVGAMWEVFEFGMDRFAGTTMQKPVPGDPSGLTDTMRDLVVDVLGALAISLFGWWHMAKERPSFIERWIERFVTANPSLFRGNEER